MLRQLEPLRLVVRAEAEAIEPLRALQHMLVDEPADDLAVFENERHFVAAHFQNRPTAASSGLGMTEAGIEETGIMDPEFTDQRIEGRHFGGIERRDMHRLTRDENIELVRIKDKFVAAATVERLPEI